MPQIHIFLNEFGNVSANPDQPAFFSHLLLTAVVLEESQLPAARQLWEELSPGYRAPEGHAPADEAALEQRRQMLEQLRALDFTVLSLVINKSKLTGEGLARPEVFYKFFHRLFIKQFPGNYRAFSIHADQLGWPEFRQNLQHYIDTQVIQRDLFAPDRTYRLVADPGQEPLAAMAAFIGACLGLIYCTSHSHPRAAALFELLHDRSFVHFFPFERTDYQVTAPVPAPSQNEQIARIAAQSACQALADRTRLSEESLAVLSYLYLMFRTAPDRLIEKYEIIEKVRKVHPGFSEQQLRACIQHLRDYGVLIASIQGKSGYKLPDRVEDIAGFYNRYLNSIVPMINRINICHRKLLADSVQQVDLLHSYPGYALLQELIQTLHKSQQAAPPLKASWEQA